MSKSDTKQFENVALTIVKKRYPKAQNITVESEREFQKGQILTVSFTENKEYNYEFVYFEKGRDAPIVFSLIDDVVNFINDRQLRSLSDTNMFTRILDSSGISGVIALMFAAAIIFLAIQERAIDEKFWNIMILIVGFYFGSKVPSRESA